MGYLRLPTGRPIGGTLTSAFTVIGFALLVNFTDFNSSSIWYFVGLAVIIVVGLVATHFSLRPHEHDPRRVVFDELAGMWATFAFVPLSFEWYWDVAIAVVVFITFRINDMLKPLGVSYVERLPGTWGVMLDDVAAGVVGAVIINIARLLASLIG